MLVFAAFGAVVGVFSGAIPAMARQTGLGSEALGLGLTVMTFANVAVMGFGGALARRFPHPVILLASLPLLGLYACIDADGKITVHVVCHHVHPWPRHRRH